MLFVLLLLEESSSKERFPRGKQVQKKAADMLGREGVAMLDRLANTLGLSNLPSNKLLFQ